MSSQLISIRDFLSNITQEPFSSSLYSIFFIQEESRFTIDGTSYHSQGNIVLFLSPYQVLIWQKEPLKYRLLSFHGDFYCIEYHKYEVACNGLLFNNAYLKPYVEVDDNLHAYLHQLTNHISKEKASEEDVQPFTSSIIKSYLQLLLALCSRQKNSVEVEQKRLIDQQASLFERLLEEYHLSERRVSFYANRLGISPEVLSRKSKQAFGKTPTQLIQDRVIIAAKKYLHLTNKSIKEIAMLLKFEDEFYFSRYFKKATGLSPKYFREEVGISIIDHNPPPQKE